MKAAPKLIQILQSFSSEDWRECADFIHGRLRKGHDCIVLYDQLRSFHHSKMTNMSKLEKIKSSCFANITEKSFTNLFSKLTIVVEDYLVLRSVLNNNKDYKLYLLQEYAERGLYNLFDRKSREIEKAIYEQKEINLFDQLTLLKLNHTRFFSDNPIKINRGEDLLERLGESNRKFHNQYDIFLEAIHRHFIEISTQKKTQKDPLKMPNDLEQILQFLLLLTKNRDKKSFTSLYNVLLKNQLSLSLELRSIIIATLIHFGHTEIKQGNLSGIRELLDLYEYGFDSELLLTNKAITENRFINLISTASACGAFERADNIIKNYSNLLLEKTKEGVIQIANAHIEFYKGEYDNVLLLIRDFPFNSHSQLTRRRWLMLCSYYKVMNEEWEFLMTQIKNYNGYFYTNKNKLSTSVYEGSLNLGRVILKFTKGRDLKEIVKYAEACEHLIFRKWLQSEFGEMSLPEP